MKRLSLFLLLICAGTSGAQINFGHSGAWFNPQTPGQGILVEILPDNGIFAAWFTYEPAAAKIGAPEHRWLTGQGTWSGDTAELTLFNTAGGVFDTPRETITEAVGEAVLRFPSCTEGSFSYSFDSEDLSGAFDLVRISGGETCEALGESARAVTITHLSNEGVLISDGDNKVVIDGLTRSTGGWISLGAADLMSLEAGTPPYDGIDLALVTHNHGDHMTFSSIDPFLAANAQAVLIGPGQMIGGVASQAQTLPVPLQRFEQETVAVGEMTVTVYSTRHFNQFGNDFSGVENYAYLVEIAGKRILHVGDIDYAEDNFTAMGLAQTGVDAVVLPTFNLLINAANFDLVGDLITPTTIIAAHFQASQVASEASRVLGLLPDAVIFDEPLDSVTIE